MIKGRKKLIEYYNKEKITEYYDRSRFFKTFGKVQNEIEIEIINNTISKNKDLNILEIAIGTGRITKNLKFNGQGLGIDSSPNMLRLAKKNVKNKQWRFKERDVFNLKSKKKFDAVISFRLLRHFTKEERLKAFNNINKVIKNSGILIFDMPNKNKKTPLLDLAQLIFGKKKNAIFEYQASTDEIIDELKSYNFKILSLYNNKPATLFIKVISFINDLFHSKFLDVLVYKFFRKNLENLRTAVDFVVICKKV